MMDLIADTVESAKEMASEGVEKAKDVGSRIADKGHSK